MSSTFLHFFKKIRKRPDRPGRLFRSPTDKQLAPVGNVIFSAARHCHCETSLKTGRGNMSLPVFAEVFCLEKLPISLLPRNLLFQTYDGQIATGANALAMTRLEVQYISCTSCSMLSKTDNRKRKLPDNKKRKVQRKESSALLFRAYTYSQGV